MQNTNNDNRSSDLSVYHYLCTSGDLHQILRYPCSQDLLSSELTTLPWHSGTAGQTASGCWTTSRRWHRGELFLSMFASKITVKYPQTHDCSTWFYLTKLLTSRPLGFPAVLLLAGTLFCLSCSAAGGKQMLSFKKTELPRGKHIPVF